MEDATLQKKRKRPTATVQKRLRRIAKEISVNQQQDKCFWCGEKMLYQTAQESTPKTRKKIFTVEHLVPLSCGGQNLEHNLVGACLDCNSRRGNKMPTFWELVEGWDRCQST